MQRASAILGSVIFLVIAPGFVAGVAPWWITHWVIGPPFLGLTFFRFSGVALIAASAPIVLDSFARFAIQGLGTPAPVAPPKHLVVPGLYRHVRNPMYVGVTAAIAGQALFFGSTLLLTYGALVWVAFFAFVVLYEERKLRRTFGVEYDTFCRNVPRWAPRLRPWQG